MNPCSTACKFDQMTHGDAWNTVASAVLPTNRPNSNTSVTSRNRDSIPHRIRYGSSTSTAGTDSPSSRSVRATTGSSPARVTLTRRTSRRPSAGPLPTHPHSSVTTRPSASRCVTAGRVASAVKLNVLACHTMKWLVFPANSANAFSEPNGRSATNRVVLPGRSRSRPANSGTRAASLPSPSVLTAKSIT